MIIFRSRGEVAVVVYDSKITLMNAPGGMIYRYTDNKGATTARFAKAFAPKRTGHLAGSIAKETRQTSRDRVVSRVRARARYATWVHEGTGPIIYPKNGRYLSIPRTSAHRFDVKGHQRMLRPWVRGQAPNPFLARALAASMAGPSFPRPLGPATPFV